MMKSPNTSRLILLIAATMLLTGCALKPRLQSRFHSNTADSSCSCYTCKNAGSHVESDGEEYVNAQDYASSVEASSPITVESDTQVPTPARSLYQLPETDEPDVATDPSAFQRPALNTATETDEASIINEVQPTEADVDLDKVEAKIESNPVEGGEFRPTETSRRVESLEATEDLSKADAPNDTLQSDEALEPLEEAENQLDSSSWGASPSDLLLPTTEDSSDELLQTSDNSIDSFFGRETTVPQAKPLPQPKANDKVVLRANPVDRNVVYCPPSKSVSGVVVPALQASFKNAALGNNLRGYAHTAQPAIEATASIVNNDSFANRVQVTEAEPQPRTIPVRLRAIPMTEQMIKGKQVRARFKAHEPSQQVNSEWHLEKFPAKQIPQPIPVPRLEALQPELILEIADPDASYSLHEHTARADDSSGTAIPPWRME